MFKIAPRIVPITRVFTALTALITCAARFTQSLLDIISCSDSYEDARNGFWNEMGYRKAQQLRDKLAHIQKSASIDGNRIHCEMDTQSRESNRELETMTLDENTSEFASPIGISHGNDEPENLLETLSEPLKLVYTKSKEIFETIVKDLGNYGNREESTFVRKKPSSTNLSCPFCKMETETFDHLFECISGLYCPSNLRSIQFSNFCNEASVKNVRRIAKFLLKYLKYREDIL